MGAISGTETAFPAGAHDFIPVYYCSYCSIFNLCTHSIMTSVVYFCSFNTAQKNCGRIMVYHITSTITSTGDGSQLPYQ